MSLLGLVGCSSGTSQVGKMPAAPDATASKSLAGDIIIGVAVSLSGERADDSADVVNGVQIAVADINKKGGLLGRRLQVVTADDRCGIARAEEAARKLVAANISLAVGHFCSVSTHAVAGIYAARNIVEITPASTSTTITEFAKLRHWTTLFRVTDNESESGRFTARYFVQHYADRPIAFIHADDLSGVTTARSFRAELQDHGMSPVIDRSLSVSRTGLDNLIADLRQANVAAIFIAGDASDTGAAVRAIRDAGINADVYGSAWIDDEAFHAAAGPAGDGTRFGKPGTIIDASLAPGLAGKYDGKGTAHPGYVARGYAAVQSWAAGVTRASSLDGTAVAAAMRQAPVDTAIGRLSWDAKGDLETSLYRWYVWQGDAYRLNETE
ncbi:MAG TPA: branched-chain amino acid ABC transporter substrate-binding protein [Terriglobales bacterium]|nr:branched-chain amino acid ABC transporter substrate-binding protein [Terriglobales bacterium]